MSKVHGHHSLIGSLKPAWATGNSVSKTEDDDKEEEAGVVMTIIRFIYQDHNNLAG